MPADAVFLPTSREQIEALIPHQGGMCLLECVESWSAGEIVCSTRSHVSEDHPLRRNGELAAVHLCEYGAQAMAVHGGLMAHQRGTTADPGLLVSLRDVILHVTRITPTGTLRVSAQRLQAGPSGSQYEFAVSRDGQTLATGRAMVMTAGKA